MQTEIFNQVFAQVHIGIVLCDRKGEVTAANPCALRLFRWDHHNLPNIRQDPIWNEQGLSSMLDHVLTANMTLRHEITIPHKQHIRVFRVQFRTISAEQIMYTFEEISSLAFMQQRLRQQVNFERAISTICRELLADTELDNAIQRTLDIVGRVTQLSRVYVIRLSGSSREVSSILQWCATEVSPHNELSAKKVYCSSQTDLTALENGDRLLRADAPSTLLCPVHINGSLLYVVGFEDCKKIRTWSTDELSILDTFVYIVAHALKRDMLEESLLYLSSHDYVTGLANRIYFEQAIADAQKSQEDITLFVLDIDNLKQINDKLGHAIGDQAIKATANIMDKSFPPDSVIARTGGDEFSVFVNRRLSEQEISRLLESFRQAIAEYNRSHSEFVLSISCGYSFSRSPAESFEEIAKRADEAMYCDKYSRKSIVLISR